MAIIFKHTTDPSKKHTNYVKSKTVDMRAGDDTEDIITKLIDPFLENYEREENIHRNGNDFIFDCVDLTLLSQHRIKKRQIIHLLQNGYQIRNQLLVDKT